jgi:hypothetical protein
LKSFPDRQKLYARYLLDMFHAECKAFEVRADAVIVHKVRREASGKIEKLIERYENGISD